MLRRWTIWAGRSMALLRSRQALGQLDDHLLQDIGLTPAQMRGETRRWCLDTRGFAEPETPAPVQRVSSSRHSAARSS